MGTPGKPVLSNEILYNWLRKNTSTKKRVTIKEVAEHFRLSRHCVGFYLNSLVIDPDYNVNRIVFGDKYQFYAYKQRNKKTIFESFRG